MTDHDMLKRLDQRQEVLILAMREFNETIRTMDAKIDRLTEWLQQPGSTVVLDTLREVLTEVRALPARILSGIRP